MLTLLGKSSRNNINVGGTLDGALAPTVPAWHPAFETVLEDGVRDLCLYFAKSRKWITYTSCEGHQAEGASQIPSLRHVGILPRSLVEHHNIHHTLVTAILAYSRMEISNRVPAGLILHLLRDAETAAKVIDLVFIRDEATSWTSYFDRVDEATVMMLEILSETG
ncbi:hypothetical protein KXS07_02485 [Inquilinus limosus]|uniref:hypothetical protein n=1 Tax=Inquilinus limosus TaxID=171674 RepID=UPI003F17B8C1